MCVCVHGKDRVKILVKDDKVQVNIFLTVPCLFANKAKSPWFTVIYNLICDINKIPTELFTNAKIAAHKCCLPTSGIRVHDCIYFENILIKRVLA